MRGFGRLAGIFDLRGLGPVAHVQPREGFRAAVGAVLGLALTVLVAYLFSPDLWLTLYMIAPFGASSVLLYAAPNSPLAQPWPTIVGNTVSALAAIAVCMVVSDPMFNIPLSVGAAIFVMALCRATHPPGGSVALTVGLGAERVLAVGFSFALLPVAAGTIVLVLFAALYAPLTGRRYPLRQFNEPNPNGTKDPSPIERLGLSEDELTDILSRYRQSLNLGVEDLARLIAAAQMQAASHQVTPQVADDIMSRDLVTVLPTTPVEKVASLFIEHGFTSLPVVDEGGAYLGVIFQLHLIAGKLGDQQKAAKVGFKRFVPTLSRDKVMVARDVMATPSTATTQTPIAALVPMLAQSRSDAVPVLDGERIVGIVTQTDLIAALARASLRLG
jgi:CBS domain-containing membrane protein